MRLQAGRDGAMQKSNLVSCPSTDASARDEMRVVEARFAVGEVGTVERRHAAAGGEHDGVAGGGVPLPRPPEARIEIGDPLGHETELEGAAGDAVAADGLVREKGVE